MCMGRCAKKDGAVFRLAKKSKGSAKTKRRQAILCPALLASCTPYEGRKRFKSSDSNDPSENVTRPVAIGE